MKSINRRLFRVGLLVAFFTFGFSNAYADAWVINAFLYSRSFASAQVPGETEIDDSGVVFDQTMSKADADNGSAVARALAASRNNWGGTVSAAAAGDPGAVAGPRNPFADPLRIQVGPGSASLDYDVVVLGPGVLTITGSAGFNANGFLELSVLDVSGLSPDFVSSILLEFGSVERAITLGGISPGRVLTIHRETSSLFENGTFSIDVNIGTLALDDVAVLGMAHAVADVPEPATMLLLGTGLAGVAIRTRQRLKNGKDR